VSAPIANRPVHATLTSMFVALSVGDWPDLFRMEEEEWDNIDESTQNEVLNLVIQR
jgi:hypothetical protein